MSVNGVNISSDIKWTENTNVVRKNADDIINSPKPANVDKMVLRLPVSETVYTRKELLKGSSRDLGDEHTACVTTYKERVLTFEDGSTISGRSNDAYFAIYLDKNPRDFYSSGVDMRDIESAVEETWVYKERSLDGSTLTVSASALFSGSDFQAGGKYGMNVVNTEYKYAAAGLTEGTVTRKDGSVESYTHTAAKAEITSVSSKELYEIITGQSYDSTHIGLDEALEKYPLVKLGKAEQNVDTFVKSNESAGLSRILGFLKHGFGWAKAGVQGCSAEELASMIGTIGKRIDDAFKAGKFTYEEYAGLNKDLEEYASALTARSERALATVAAGKENQSLLGKVSPQKYKDKLNAEIEKYLTDKNSKHYCGIDREALLNMINSVRYGNAELLNKMI